MVPHLRLRGQRFLVTRPEGQGGPLLDGIRALGGEAEQIPFLGIAPVRGLEPLQHVADQLTTYRACLFVSANAIQCAWSTLTRASAGAWPQDIVTAVVGPGSAKALRAHGVSQIIVPPSRFDSEGLLEEPFFAEAACRGQAFAMIRGEGGRNFLAQSLRARGARVDEVAVYRRELHPDAMRKVEAWVNQTRPDHPPGMLLISSSESIQRVMAEATPALAVILKRCPVLVPHPKIAEAVCQLGFERVAVSEGGDAGMLAYLQTYNA